MQILLLIVLIVLLGLLIYCAIQESKIIAVYKANHVFGRLKAYLAMDLSLCGLFMYLVSSFGGFFPQFKEMESYGIIGVIGGALLLGAGLYMYYTTYISCPDELKKNVILDMVIVAFGVSMKVVLFFLPIIWRIANYTGPVYTSKKAEKKVNVYREDQNGYRHYYKVNSTQDYYQDEDGEWHKIRF